MPRKQLPAEITVSLPALVAVYEAIATGANQRALGCLDFVLGPYRPKTTFPQPGPAATSGTGDPEASDHSPRLPVPATPPSNRQGQGLRCKVCDRGLANIEELALHMATDHSEAPTAAKKE